MSDQEYKHKLIEAGESLVNLARELNQTSILPAIGSCEGIYEMCPFEDCRCRKEQLCLTKNTNE